MPMNNMALSKPGLTFSVLKTVVAPTTNSTPHGNDRPPAVTVQQENDGKRQRNAEEQNRAQHFADEVGLRGEEDDQADREQGKGRNDRPPASHIAETAPERPRRRQQRGQRGCTSRPGIGIEHVLIDQQQKNAGDEAGRAPQKGIACTQAVATIGWSSANAHGWGSGCCAKARPRRPGSEPAATNVKPRPFAPPLRRAGKGR